MKDLKKFILESEEGNDSKNWLYVHLSVTGDYDEGTEGYTLYSATLSTFDDLYEEYDVGDDAENPNLGVYCGDLELNKVVSVYPYGYGFLDLDDADESGKCQDFTGKVLLLNEDDIYEGCNTLSLGVFDTKAKAEAYVKKEKIENYSIEEID